MSFITKKEKNIYTFRRLVEKMINRIVLLGTPFFEDELRSSLEKYDNIELLGSDSISYSDKTLYLFFGQSENDKDISCYSNLDFSELVAK